MSEKIKTEKAIAHPIEGILEIESGTTFLPTVEVVKTDLALAPEFDDTDNQINEQYQEIYDVAMDAYETQAGDIEALDPKYRARNQEVAVQYLNTALSAVKEKGTMKMFKDKLINKAPSGTNIKDSNVIVADRNDVLKELFERDHG